MHDAIVSFQRKVSYQISKNMEDEGNRLCLMVQKTVKVKKDETFLIFM